MLPARLGLLLIVFEVLVRAQNGASECNAALTTPVVSVTLPGHPFGVVVSNDGCRVFVAVTQGVAVLRRESGSLELERVIPLSPAPAGMVLTHDGELLIAASSSVVWVLDVQRLASGEGNPALGSFRGGLGSIYVNVTSDDKTLFISEEYGGTITVVDLARARSEGFADAGSTGRIPVGGLPIALTFSPDGQLLYTTSESAAPAWGWPSACKAEGSPESALVRPEGAVVVIDVNKARTDSANAVLARVPAGCSAVRMAMAPSGDRIYVTARNSDAVLAFDTSKLVADSANARVGSVPVGSAPVPVAVIDSGKVVLAGNSNRFAARPTEPQTLTVLDATRFQDGVAAVLGTVPAGAFPREMSVSPDGRTLFLTNFLSDTLQVMDVATLARLLPTEQLSVPLSTESNPAPMSSMPVNLANASQPRHWKDLSVREKLRYVLHGFRVVR